ncbi:hypothetical protein LM7416_120101 [Listeria monocytogenes]|nr:hypothetical protein LM500065_150030 [Listeria monocytogenes]CUL06212.1 hypothetical protein LM701145_150362 [Listeria monocytogenes]CUL22672.1 hypothetical protein LM7414_130030 [Listeria monocytogenes]CUL24393.1 hypothetical protein LM7416_120101 [Listeria monocytogenes]CUL87714.1 hypothetical protein LM7425_210081 [Listeria monocytogenes]
MKPYLKRLRQIELSILFKKDVLAFYIVENTTMEIKNSSLENILIRRQYQ